MEPWVEIATKFGIPIAALAIGAWAISRFLSKTLWPYLTAQIDKAQAAREKDLDRFAGQIGKISEEQTKALRELSDDIRGWRKGQ